MCGISGIVRLDDSPLDIIEAARSMNAAIRHRGPDGEGFLVASNDQCVPAFTDETPSDISDSSFAFSPKDHIGDAVQVPMLILGHRRLSIIDLSPGGHQPMCTPDRKHWITYNGEIYNYRELRSELEAKGRKFVTQSDIEVILHAWLEWGEACLQRFNGMWAFVIYNADTRQLFGSRDRFGVKPFYYYHDKHVFTFASEQKALLKNAAVKTSLNPDAVADYFLAGEIEYETESFFKNIFELFPAHAFTLDLRTKKFKQWAYYQLNVEERFEAFRQTRFDEHRERVAALFTDAVRLRLRSDVPVGSCLSGGIDSSAIAGAIHALKNEDQQINLGGQLKLFTTTFPNSPIDESQWAKEVVQRTGAEWYTVTPQKDELLRDLESLIYCQDVPIWSTSTYAQYRTVQLAADHGIRVLLDGQGGDELFAGYNPHYIFYWGELLNHFRLGRLWREVNAFGGFPGGFRHWTRDRLKYKVLPRLSANRQVSIMRNYFDDLKYLDEGLIERYRVRLSEKKKEVPQTLNAMLSSEFVNTRLKGYLKCEDRCSMWHSVESRTPFADDHPLIEYTFAVPGQYKIRNGTSKHLLREAVRPYLPDSIYRRRDKMGYITPNNKWLSEIHETLRPYFDQDFSGILNKDLFEKDYKTLFSAEGKPENGRLFKFMAFAVWRKVFGM